MKWYYIQFNPQPDISAFVLATILQKVAGRLAHIWCREDVWTDVPSEEKRHFKIMAQRQKESTDWPVDVPTEQELNDYAEHIKKGPAS